jgi:Alpha-kinase family
MQWDTMKPEGHGFYMPALEKIRSLLDINNHGSCSLSVLFFSDGKPSDWVENSEEFTHANYLKTNEQIIQCVGDIASRFGRRLHLAFVGMADEGEDFRTLQEMADEARSYGASATFNRPSLNANSLSQIIYSSVASSLSSKSELTCLRTGRARAVRMNVKREQQGATDGKKPSDDEWRLYYNADLERFVVNIWVWSTSKQDFVALIDPRCRDCFTVVAGSDYKIISPSNNSKKKKKKGAQEEAVQQGQLCEICRACFYCHECSKGPAIRQHRKQECADLARQCQTGHLVMGDFPPSYSVAWKCSAFGEGAERLAFKFRFLKDNGKFFGPMMVAKESRFVEDMENMERNYLLSERHSYHRAFMRTQAEANRYAQMFNDDMASKLPPRDISYLVKIRFLNPQIFELEDVNTGTSNLLVEPMIKGDYVKFTNNCGNLKTDEELDVALPRKSGINAALAAELLGREAAELLPRQKEEPDNLNVIEEGSEDDDSAEESDEGSDEEESGFELDVITKRVHFEVMEVPEIDYLHAFSHFSYVRSGGSLMVVDLQGALTVEKGQRVFVLTDPAIHHRPGLTDPAIPGHKRGPYRVLRQFGRTDRGSQGMLAFFESHRCNAICRLFNFVEKKAARECGSGLKAEREQ